MFIAQVQKILGNNGRTALIRKNIFASFLIKGWSVVIQFLLVPLTLHCLGNYENGIWLTISSMLLWIDNLDIGLGNGLRNKLAENLAHEDKEKARDVVSSTLFMLILVIVPVIILINILIWFTDTYSFFNIDGGIVGNLNVILATASILVCSTFIFKFIGNFYMGLQLTAVNNLLVTSGQTLALIGTALVYLSGSRSLLLISIVNTLSPLVVYLVSYPITFYGKYAYLRPRLKGVRLSVIKELFDTGMKFFVLQIAGIVLFMSSNIIISRLFSPEMVTPFQIAYRYFSVIILLFTIICVPYWTATTDAYHRKDIDWIRSANNALNKVIAVFTIVAVLMIAVSAPVYRIWVGGGVEIPLSMTVLVAVYIMILTISTRYSYVLNGIGALRLQLIMTICAAVAYIPLAVFFGRLTNSINMLIGIMCIVNLPGLVINIVQYNKIVNAKAKGIWIK
ncbi:MAG: hypothetical protein LUC88_06315 [Prevotella sp.]|nr:hypothetical protein [Prevotella sp.]